MNHMREMTASEAARNFSAVLTAAEGGETIIVTRAGQRVAVIAPAARANGAELRDVLAKWRGNTAFDAEFDARVAAARGAVDPELDADAWLG